MRFKKHYLSELALTIALFLVKGSALVLAIALFFVKGPAWTLCMSALMIIVIINLVTDKLHSNTEERKAALITKNNHDEINAMIKTSKSTLMAIIKIKNNYKVDTFTAINIYGKIKKQNRDGLI
ncbi:hypothetical protein [Lactobacillus sp. Sy-1]|uniref:hypothetical protein n=1 Tax=Lactobacillus sp. Sy-1 TaxID=2109645 RepID=UPI001C5ABEE6|nr:hypothetical protein [Lactobacillus sp. Sy-1]MBW1606337.1 hypothetical protein [Lactobacillus sp. Sy-1]